MHRLCTFKRGNSTKIKYIKFYEILKREEYKRSIQKMSGGEETVVGRKILVIRILCSDGE